MRSGVRRVLLGGAILLAAGSPAWRPVGAAPAAGDVLTVHGVDVAAMDRSVAPGDDFFAYANGTWLKRTEIPADRASFGIGTALSERVEQQNLELIRGAAAARAPAGSELRLIGDYFTAFMDTAAIEAVGLAPLRPALDRIGAIGDRTALASFLGGTLRADVDLLNNTDEYTENILGVWVAQDLDEPQHYSVFLVQGGLGMPDREYYVSTAEDMRTLCTRYQAHVARVLALAGFSDAEARAARIVDLERGIAAGHSTREASISVRNGNNHWARADFDTRAPGLDWAAFFAAAGLGGVRSFVVWQPGAVTGISSLAGSRPLEDWRDYLTFHAIEKTCAVLPAAFDAEHFAFHGRVLNGIPQQRARVKRAVVAVNDALGEAVGKLYVEHHFPPSEKARAQAMVGRLLAAFRERIDRLDWMAPETKARAKAKLAVLKVGVGYPDRWRDYSGLRVDAADAFGDAERAGLFDYGQSLARLGQPVDRDEWVMTPQTVNAVNLPAMNALNFPAAILQPPFFDPRAPAAVDYANTGATIGHEISHSFDDQGALFDASGRLSKWWTDEDLAHFRAAAAKLAAQFSAYEPYPGLHVNGQQTLGENIADLAGLEAAHDAYLLLTSGRPAPASNGFADEQQFFIGYAQGWRTKAREAAERQDLITDGHALPRYRAQVVRNLDAWYAAFDVKPGQALYLAPDLRVRMW